MPKLALDFAQPAPRFNSVWMLILLGLVSLIAAYFVLDQQQMQQVITKQNAQNNAQKNTNLTNKPNPELAAQLTSAHLTQAALNMPWQPMLVALERASQQNPAIKLSAIQPKPERSEVLISGEAAEFDVIVQYLNSLRQQPELGEAVLLNQHVEQDAESGKSTILFNLSVAWQK